MFRTVPLLNRQASTCIREIGAKKANACDRPTKRAVTTLGQLAAHRESVNFQFNDQATAAVQAADCSDAAVQAVQAVQGCDRQRRLRNSSGGALQRWTFQHLPLMDTANALDVACGDGRCARMIAPRVASVTAIDSTQGVLDQAKELALQDGLDNIEWRLGDGETLPFADNYFDLVTCRFALHHFAEPERQIAEMVRVVRPGGHVAVIDSVAPDEEDLAVAYNRLERLRDPTHTQALSLAGLRRMLLQAAPFATFAYPWETPTFLDPVPMEAWMNMVEVPEACRSEITSIVQRELSGGPRTGMRPRLDSNGKVTLYHQYAALVAKI